MARKVILAQTFVKRFLGWMGRTSVNKDEALVLAPCQIIHTCFMRFALDVIFLGHNGEILFTLSNLQPFRLSPLVRKSRMVIELPAGRLEQTNTVPGDRLKFYYRKDGAHGN